jgi:hypothetical protein
MIPVSWVEREPPLAPVAVHAAGRAARALGRTLLARGAGRWEGVVSGDCIVVVGDDLPWVQGCAYLGRDPRCPSLLLPTAVQPTVATELLERALLRRFPTLAAPLAVLGDLVLPLGGARTLAPGPLEDWLEGRH